MPNAAPDREMLRQSVSYSIQYRIGRGAWAPHNSAARYASAREAWSFTDEIAKVPSLAKAQFRVIEHQETLTSVARESREPRDITAAELQEGDEFHCTPFPDSLGFHWVFGKGQIVTRGNFKGQLRITHARTGEHLCLPLDRTVSLRYRPTA